ncbi:MAG: cob(I)yrinic acid a,c-diamide adenosyltransferase [Candidatus Limnocylindria bacterium]
MPAARRSARVTTRTGDRGDTSLFGRGRVRKTDPRVAALGDLDEAQAALGLARAAAKGTVAATILELQRGLYLAMSEVATPRSSLARLPRRIDAAAVEALDTLVGELRTATDVGGRFVVPGEDPRSAALDLARTVARRAERSVVALVDAKAASGEHLVPWLNRLSDVLFLLARAVEARARPAGAGQPRGR